jgi:hypothetical protein
LFKIGSETIIFIVCPESKSKIFIHRRIENQILYTFGTEIKYFYSVWKQNQIFCLLRNRYPNFYWLVGIETNFVFTVRKEAKKKLFIVRNRTKIFVSIFLYFKFPYLPYRKEVQKRQKLNFIVFEIWLSRECHDSIQHIFLTGFSHFHIVNRQNFKISFFLERHSRECHDSNWHIFSFYWLFPLSYSKKV